ncbi:peptide chain release factor 2 [Treponema rectale]|uniref:Peptide chain release factor 2 n=1 Tax=Treponema rectale TaxID=744512 RepID=A0A840SAS4_9SPIR|nr:peptide chain release factor 2 [Treponema rectale]MBB5217914.1 peptide chain release factor 2 [Treponema rectale]QOS40367.1 peptide chain release factor 2 [Treponema rectale]
MLEDLKEPVEQLKKDIDDVWSRLNPEEIRGKIAEKEALTTAEGFWDDNDKATKVMNDIKMLKGRIEPWEELRKASDDMLTLYELGMEEGDQGLESELKEMYEKAKAEFDHQSILNLLSDEVDKNDCFLSVHAGAGGTEACDWTFMLSRMYQRWAERHGYKVEVLSQEEAEGGLKSINMKISGPYVFGYTKGEAGVHRLVRISPFDANARRHTSFASVYVFPVLDDSIEVNIDPKDLRVDTYRSGGKGGQHVNKTESAVRFTHLPTGIVVACDSERSQLMNRATAMSILRSRLYEYYKEQQEKENSKFAGEKKDISFGSQIRSYVFQPYTMVKDHRTKYSVGNIQGVMDGDIDGFLDSYLSAKWKGVASDGDDDDDIGED